MYFNCGTGNINRTFIIEPLATTGGTNVMSACTGFFTNLILSCSGDTVIEMGTNAINVTGGINTTNTIDTPNYLSGGTNLLNVFSDLDIFVTGGTFNDLGDTLTLNRNDDSNVIITGITNYFTTGGTYDNNTGLITFNRNDQLSAFTVDLTSLDINDTFVTGGTFNNSTDTISLTRNDGINIPITGITDNFTTAATLVNSTVYFDRNDQLSAFTLDLSALDVNDTYISGVTLSGNILTLNRNDNVNIPLNLDEIIFSGGSGDCISDLYVSNIHGCSPITIHDELNVSGNTNFSSALKLTQTPRNDNNLTQIIARSSDGVLKYRDVSSIVGAASGESRTTGSTLIGSTAYFDRADTLSAFTLDLSSLDVNDTFVTGGTYDGSSIITFTNNDNNTFNVTGIIDTYLTGVTSDTGGTMTFSRNDDVDIVVNVTETKEFDFMVFEGAAISSTPTYISTTGALVHSFGGSNPDEDQSGLNFTVPSDYISGGTFYLKFMTLSTTDDIQFEMNVTSVNVGGDMSSPTDTGLTVVTQGSSTNYELVKTSAFTGGTATFEANKNIALLITRDASDAPDTYTGDALLWSVTFEYVGVK